MECGPRCEPTCLVPSPVSLPGFIPVPKNDGSFQECEEDCALDVCRCKEGYIRSESDGPCIEPSGCPPGESLLFYLVEKILR